MNPISIIPQKNPPRRRRRHVVSSSPAPAGPVLVAATYDPLTPSVTFTFDRAVNLAGEGGFLNPETITVLDGVDGAELLNTLGADGAGTATLVVVLFPNAAWAGAGVTMSCGAGTGIVAADGGEAWAGVTGLELPFA